MNSIYLRFLSLWYSDLWFPEQTFKGVFQCTFIVSTLRIYCLKQVMWVTYDCWILELILYTVRKPIKSAFNSCHRGLSNPYSSAVPKFICWCENIASSFFLFCFMLVGRILDMHIHLCHFGIIHQIRATSYIVTALRM